MTVKEVASTRNDAALLSYWSDPPGSAKPERGCLVKGSVETDDGPTSIL